MRILKTVHCELDLDAGGPGVTLRLADAYRAAGHDVVMCSFDDLPARLSPIQKSLLFPHLVARRASKIASRGALDVIDAFTGDASVYATVTKRVGRPLLVTRSHGLEHTMHESTLARANDSGEQLSWKYPLYHGGYRLWEVARSLRLADVSLFLNEHDRQTAIARLQVQPQSAVLMRNGIADELIALPPPGPVNGHLRIAVIGSYIDRKGITFAAEALNRVLPKHPTWSVTFLGTGCEPARVFRDYDPALHDRITVVPHYSNRGLPKILASHQVHLFPTLMEGGPLSLLEAMACGLVPVVTRVPGPIDVVRDGHDALLVPPEDSTAIVATLEKLAAQPALLEQLRRNAHKTAQRYGWHQVAAEQLEIYEAHLARTDRRAGR